jgi:hypothetical protein
MAKTFFPRSKSLTGYLLLPFEKWESVRVSTFEKRSVLQQLSERIQLKQVNNVYSLLSDSGSDSQPIINSRPLVDGEFDYTAKHSRRSFPGLPDFRDRLSCRLARDLLFCPLSLRATPTFNRCQNWPITQIVYVCKFTCQNEILI